MDGPPSDNIYITGLPEEFNSDAVNQFFSACGTVVSSKTLGYGNAMVRFASAEEAMVVKQNMNGQQPMGCPKPLGITFATEKKHDDWQCPRCGDKQFAKNAVCRMCMCPKPTGDMAEDMAALAALGAWDGAQAAWNPPSGKGKSKGKAPQKEELSAPGDWFCPACNDKQFARNATCRICSCPKEGWAINWQPTKVGSTGVISPYGGGKGKGKGAPAGMGWVGGIKDVIDALISEGLPGGNFDRDKNALYITNLPHDTTAYGLYVMFACFGAVPPRGVRVMPGQPGQRLYGFINFMENANAEFAMMAMNGVVQPDGCKLIVKFKDSPATKGAGKGGWAPTNQGWNAIQASSGGVDAMMMGRLKKKMATGGMMTAFDLSQWYIIEFLGHVTDPGEMKETCDLLLAACAALGLA